MAPPLRSGGGGPCEAWWRGRASPIKRTRPRKGFSAARNGRPRVRPPPPPAQVAGVDRIEFCGEQFGEMARVAARPGGAEPDVLDAAVDSVKAESEPARAHPFARQSRREILGQALDRAGEIGGIGDRLGKAQPHPPARGFAER